MIVIQPSHNIIETTGIYQSYQYNNQKLFGWSPFQNIIDEYPYHDVNEIKRDDRNRRANMREAHFYEEMMKMRFVCLERRDSSGYSSNHHSQCIKNGN